MQPPFEFAIPSVVRRRALNLGDEGRAWLRSLDVDVPALVAEWDLELGEVLEGGSAAFVAEVTMPGGASGILKIGVPGSDAGTREARILEAAAGEGYARIFRYDGPRRAMLLERLGRRLVDLPMTPEKQMATICEVLHVAWRQPPPGLDLMNGAQKADSLAEFITRLWNELREPCSRAVLDQALAYAARRRAAYAPERAILAHGDAHAANTLESLDGAATGFKFIDPEGMFIERAYDVSLSMRDWSEPFLEGGDSLARGWERARFLASLTGVDAEAVWEWGFTERVSTGLLLKQLRSHYYGDEMLEVAEIWVRQLSDA